MTPHNVQTFCLTSAVHVYSFNVSGATDQSAMLLAAQLTPTSNSTSNSTSTEISLKANTATITNDGATQLTFRVTGLTENVSVVVLLNGSNGTLSESSGSADSTGTYSGSLSYQGPYAGPATLSATDNLGDVSNILNVTVT